MPSLVGSEMCIRDRSKTIWFSYKNKFLPLIPYYVQNKELVSQFYKKAYDSDSGWGCMIRAGQMIFGEALQRYRNKRLAKDKKAALTSIIQSFIDNDENQMKSFPYSIQKIVKCAYKKFTLLPGQWYTPNRILFVLQSLHQGDQDQNLRQTEKVYPLDGYENLRMEIFMNDRPLILEDLLKGFCGEKAKICKIPEHNDQMQPKKNSNQQNQILLLDGMEEAKSNNNKLVIFDEPQVANQLPKGTDYKFPRLVCPKCHKPVSENQSLVIFIVCKLGLDHPEEKYLKITNNFLSYKHSIGAIGGKPNKALYFVGRHNSNYIFLDPHKVQQAASLKDFDSYFETYFYKELLAIPSKYIDTSVAFGFFFFKFG
eukprot:TRINITY_DN7218_c0_g1_i3.p1 TRINITY_DN7218_c0_g1~~TRINITY_DN7218_c0_g1_i3.p1  ORF type:complete len:369 (-),score=55.56 TRINITY_DN7218_c0_g1_i3:732-1838(-)